MTHDEWMAEMAQRKADDEARAKQEEEEFKRDLKPARKLLRSVKATAVELGHEVVDTPGWTRWGSGLRAQLYCSKCHRMVDVIYRDDGDPDLDGHLHKNACGKSLLKVEQKEVERMEAIAHLRSLLKPGDDVYVGLQNVSTNGMSRRITVHVPRTVKYGGKKRQEIWDVSGYAARALEWTYNRDHGAVVVGGAGMDAGFHLVHSLSYVLFWYVPGRDGKGYALSHRWL